MLEQFKTSSGKNSHQYSMTLSVSVKELIYGRDALLQNSSNNNKYQNMLIIQEEDANKDIDNTDINLDGNVYLVMPTKLRHPRRAEDPERFNPCDMTTEEIPPEVQEAITKINELKYQCGPEVQVANAAKFIVLDVRFNKKHSKSTQPSMIE